VFSQLRSWGESRLPILVSSHPALHLLSLNLDYCLVPPVQDLALTSWNYLNLENHIYKFTGIPSGQIGTVDYHLYGHKPWSFPPNHAPKMRESQQLFFGLRLVNRICEEFQYPAIQTTLVQHFGGFFHQISQPLGRKDSIQVMIRTSRRMDSFLYAAAQDFEVFLNIQKWNKKIKNI
jgi:hypothetical protein